MATVYSVPLQSVGVVVVYFESLPLVTGRVLIQWFVRFVLCIRLWITTPISFILASATLRHGLSSGCNLLRTVGTVPSGPYSMTILGRVLISLVSACT